MGHSQRLDWWVVYVRSRSSHLYTALLAPLTVTLVCLLLVNQHPSPVDNCPCFESAIAVVSILLGTLTSFWCSKRVPALNADLFISVTPGASFDSPVAVTTWMLFALLKLTTGVLAILGWRMLAKPTVQALLPSFRWLARASPVRLPLRRHFTPATEYSHGPPHTLRAVPHMNDLDLATKRCGTPTGCAQEKSVVVEALEGSSLEDDKVERYHDTDGACASDMFRHAEC